MANRCVNSGNSVRLYFWGLQSHSRWWLQPWIERRLLLGRKVMTNLDSIFKSRDITLPTKVRLVKAMVFPVVMYGCESWTVKKAECQRIDAFQLWYWRRLFRVPWTARRSNQSILKEISPGCSLEGLMLKLKLQYFGHLMRSWLVGKYPDAGRDWGQEEKGTTEDEMAGWHHRLNAHESEWTPGVGDGQGGLACLDSWGHKGVGYNCASELNWSEVYVGFSPWDCKELDTTKWTKNNLYLFIWLCWVLAVACSIFNLHCGMWHL